MKRFHVNISVSDLEQSKRFYAQLFGCEPDVVKPDYAKWMLDDLRVNFSLTTHGNEKGVDHLGLQADDQHEFDTLRKQLRQADMVIFEQPDVTCCYARSSKAWVRDPNDVAWETFVSHGASTVYDDGSETSSARIAAANGDVDGCCAPVTGENSSCCG